MPPLAKAAVRPLVARSGSASKGNTWIYVGLGIFGVTFLPLIVYFTVRHFRHGGTFSQYCLRCLKFLGTVLCVIVFLPALILLIPYEILKPTTAPAAAAAAAGTRSHSTAQPPPLARPTMPLDPVELAPEEPDLDDPDDPASYLRRVPPAAAQPAAAGAAGAAAGAAPLPPAAPADDECLPSFEEATVQKPEAAVLRPEPPPPDYQPVDPADQSRHVP